MRVENIDYRQNGSRLRGVQRVSVTRENQTGGVRGNRAGDGIERAVEQVNLRQTIGDEYDRISAAIGIGRDLRNCSATQAARTGDDVATRIEQRDFAAGVA